MRIRDVMQRQPRAVTTDDSLLIARDLMQWTGVHYLPVLDSGRLVGVLSDVGLTTWLARHPGEERNLHNEPVADAMQPATQTCSPEEPVLDVAARMSNSHLTCLPVIDRGDLVGLVTTEDLLAAQIQQALAPERDPRADEIMSKDPVIARPDDYLLDAAGRMQERGVRHLPVVDGDRRVVGILSDRDVRAALGEAQRLERAAPRAAGLLRVSDVMTRPAVTVAADRTATQLARAFAELALGAMPVVDDDGVLLGIVSYVDVLRALVEAKA